MIILINHKVAMLRRKSWRRYVMVGGCTSIDSLSWLFVHGGLTIFGSLIITAALTSFLILLVTSVWSWSRIFASFGLFVSLSCSSIMWAYVCIKQQAPKYTTPQDYLREGRDNFALMHTVVGTEPAVLCNLRAISGHQELVFRLCSLIAGALIAVG